MKNIPDIKIGVIAGTTDWMPQDVAAENRKKLLEALRPYMMKRKYMNVLSSFRTMK